MGGTGSFPIDLVLFGMIAAFLVLRLRSILGRRSGYERPDAPATTTTATRNASTDSQVQPAPGRAAPDPASAVGQVLGRIHGADRSFDPVRFLGGAEAAFRLIVGAFASGDRVALHPLLTEDTYRSFETAIAAREGAGERQNTEIRAIPTAAIDAATLDGTAAAITVRFVSDQVNETLGADGKHVAGSDAVTEIVDLWTFERDVSRSDPAWRLAATRTG